MGLLQDIIKKVRGTESDEPEEEIPDDVTRDNYLRSLRREDRVMNEAEEKEYLIHKLAARKKELLRKYMFGMKDRINQKKEQNHSYLGKYKL